ncbi:hypothetical protein RRG08_050746 [Elysia crispata]|uniref:Uncharacterized protein n=1 Tax=Elysia crispata TaxID=231223 RepID=A0AAE1DLG5_9GAST|nr:hypothetical protein RRG08_050746 [Elysia crispata]
MIGTCDRLTSALFTQAIKTYRTFKPGFYCLTSDLSIQRSVTYNILLLRTVYELKPRLLKDISFVLTQSQERFFTTSITQESLISS